jgi:hypothetical protein
MTDPSFVDLIGRSGRFSFAAGINLHATGDQSRARLQLGTQLRGGRTLIFGNLPSGEYIPIRKKTSIAARVPRGKPDRA